VPYDLVVLAATGHGPLGRAHENTVIWLLLNVLSFSLISPLISALHVHAVVMVGQSRRPPSALGLPSSSAAAPSGD
jgi:hypothetical protein